MRTGKVSKCNGRHHDQEGADSLARYVDRAIPRMGGSFHYVKRASAGERCTTGAVCPRRRAGHYHRTPPAPRVREACAPPLSPAPPSPASHATPHRPPQPSADPPKLDRRHARLPASAAACPGRPVMTRARRGRTPRDVAFLGFAGHRPRAPRRTPSRACVRAFRI